MEKDSVYNEQELLQRAARGEEAAFADLFHLYKYKLYGYIFKLTGSHEMTEDVVQDVFLKLWKNNQALSTIQSFSAYLFQTAQNHALNAFKRMAKETLILAKLNGRAVPDATIEELLQAKEMQELLHKAVLQLSPQQKLVFTLSREQGLKHEEIAARLNISPGTVKNHMIQALRVIREQLRSYPNDLSGYMVLLTLAACFEK